MVVLCLTWNEETRMLKEVKFFDNEIGGITFYENGDGIYSIERRLRRMPGVYRCRLYSFRDKDMAEKKFDNIKNLLCALHQRRDKNK